MDCQEIILYFIPAIYIHGGIRYNALRPTLFFSILFSPVCLWMRKVFSVRVAYILNRLRGMSTSFFLLGVSGECLVDARYVFGVPIFS